MLSRIRIFAAFVLAALLAAASASFSTAVAVPTEVPVSELNPVLRHQQTMLIIRRVIESFHYKERNLDNSYSNDILDEYLSLLDSNKSYFTAADVAGFKKKYGKRFDDDIKNARLDGAFSIFKRFRERVEERIEVALKQLDKEFDFTLDESYRIDREDVDWAANAAALDELWRKRVKNDMLSMRLTKKPDEKIREQLTKRYEGVLRRTRQMNADDVFQTFMEAYSHALEPHTSYLLPRGAENFDISMSLSLQGIGAVLTTDNEYTKVQKIVPGGPADSSNQLHAGDKIIGVAQGRKGEMLDVIGWRLQDVVEKIRGKKGSVVRLQVIPKKSGDSGVSKEIVIVRDEIKLEEQAAKSSVESVDGIKIGIIELPTFYRDFSGANKGSRNFRSTTRDVRKILKTLEKQDIDGVVIDLRDNLGGSLTEATELTGLFIKSGPVVQIMDHAGNIDSEKDPDSEMVYDGPLAVVVNRNSASASEIFAGAIQDYGRGVVIGEPTYGKGTVQQLIDLSDYVSGSKDLGRMRLTIAQFFRVQGGSTQHKGVVPDIQFPTVGKLDYGERMLERALPWAKIEAADHDKWTIGKLSDVEKQHRKRIKSDPGFNYLVAEAELIQRLKDKKTVSLNEVKRKQEWESQEKERLSLHNKYRRSIGLSPLSREEFEEEDDEVLEARREEENIDQVEVKEAAHILADMISAKLAPEIRAAQVSKRNEQLQFLNH